MSHWQPGYGWANQVPPTSSARSRITKSGRPARSRLIAIPRPTKPAPMIAMSTSSGTEARRLLVEPVVDPAVSLHEQPVVAGEHAELVAVRVDRDGRLVERRDHQHARGTGHLVSALGPSWEADDVARLERGLAFGRPQRRVPGEHDQPLLVAVLEVIRADRLARIEVVDRPADQAGTDIPAESVAARLEALRLVALKLGCGGMPV